MLLWLNTPVRSKANQFRIFNFSGMMVVSFTHTITNIEFNIKHPSAPRILVALIWITFSISQFVFVEPAPYDVAIFGLAVLACFLPVKLTPVLALLIFALCVNACGQLIAAALSIEVGESMIFAATSVFLNLSAVLIAVYIFSYPVQLVPALVNGYVFAAFSAAVIGICAYFSLFGELSSEFLLYLRVKSTFKDPNVYGAFLVMPAVYCLDQILTRPLKYSLHWLGSFLVIALGILLSFSRGAWTGLVISSGISVFLLLIAFPNRQFRARILLITSVAICLAALMISIALNIEVVWKLFEIRFAAVQDYDVGSQGRFANQWNSILFIINHPLGVGFGDFGRILSETAPHNVYLLMLMTAGWLGGVAYWTLIAVTLIKGMQLVLSPMPFPIFTVSLLSTFISLVLMGLIVDTHHWRFFFIVLGIVWALIALDCTNPQRTPKPILP